MSTAAAPTAEEIQKQANAIDRRKKQGFINHLTAVGRDEKNIGEHMLPKYASQDGIRSTRLQELYEAIVPKKAA